MGVASLAQGWRDLLTTLLVEFVILQQTSLQATTFSIIEHICYITTNDANAKTKPDYPSIHTAHSTYVDSTWVAYTNAVRHHTLPAVAILYTATWRGADCSGSIACGVCRQAARYLLWISNKIYRVISALLVFALIGADGLLHVFNIPHIEGWWLPLASSLIAASGVNALVEKYKRRHSHE